MERNRIIVITPEESKYIRHNTIHKKIRKFAIERGNPQMVPAPEFETIFLYNRFDADKERRYYMVQTFENGATIEGCFDTGLVELRNKRGEVVKSWQNPQVTELTAIQQQAQSL